MFAGLTALCCKSWNMLTCTFSWCFPNAFSVQPSAGMPGLLSHCTVLAFDSAPREPERIKIFCQGHLALMVGKGFPSGMQRAVFLLSAGTSIWLHAYGLGEGSGWGAKVPSLEFCSCSHHFAVNCSSWHRLLGSERHFSLLHWPMHSGIPWAVNIPYGCYSLFKLGNFTVLYRFCTVMRKLRF